MAKTKNQQARVLSDLPTHGVVGGDVLDAADATIKILTDAGAVDPHKDAVAYAVGSGAAVKRSQVELAAEKLAAAQDALRVDIAQLKELLAKAETDADKAAIENQMLAKANELAVLG